MNVKSLIGTHDVLLMTLDTLRYDVAVKALNQGQTPNLKKRLPNGKWEMRHTPGSFTYAAHQAFFAGFLPTPARPGPHPRLFATAFPGSETTTENTCVFDTPDIVSGFASRGYHTLCIGGVGFFNKQTPLGCVLPNLFAESYWSAEMGVASPISTEVQIAQSIKCLAEHSTDKRIFLFLNISAVHQPNCLFTQKATRDSRETQAAALAYVDQQLPALFQALRRRAPVFCIVCSDHGTAYGEDDYFGHRLAHPVVWNVPYAEFVLSHSQDGQTETD